MHPEEEGRSEAKDWRLKVSSSPVCPSSEAFAFNGPVASLALSAVLFFAWPALAKSEESDTEAAAGKAVPPTQEKADDGVSLQFYDLLSPCSGDCQLTTAFGRYVETSMSNIFFDLELAPWDWDYGDINFASLTFGRKLADYGHWITFEPEVGVGRRFGDADEYEVWGALYFRWNTIFWDHIVDTSIAASTGVSYATESNELEEERVSSSNVNFLHYFSPEITLSPPGDSAVSFVIRLHHRSGAGGLFGESGGFQYLMVGLRVHL